MIQECGLSVVFAVLLLSSLRKAGIGAENCNALKRIWELTTYYLSATR
jgi:hypothetical protein